MYGPFGISGLISCRSKWHPSHPSEPKPAFSHVVDKCWATMVNHLNPMTHHTHLWCIMNASENPDAPSVTMKHHGAQRLIGCQELVREGMGGMDFGLWTLWEGNARSCLWGNGLTGPVDLNHRAVKTGPNTKKQNKNIRSICICCNAFVVTIPYGSYRSSDFLVSKHRRFLNQTALQIMQLLTGVIGNRCDVKTHTHACPCVVCFCVYCQGLNEILLYLLCYRHLCCCWGAGLDADMHFYLRLAPRLS